MNWKRLWRRCDAVIDILIWAWDMLMLFLCGAFLIPLMIIAIAGIVLLGPAPGRSELGELLDELFFVVLAMAPIWMAVAAYARFSASQMAMRLQSRINRAFPVIIYTVCVLMGIFAILHWGLPQ